MVLNEINFAGHSRCPDAFASVGTALGGPIGGLIGTVIGQSIDQQLLGGGPRRGPRLGDLSVQTASYGSMIPRLYGTMRVAGSVVWSTDLIETRELQGDGKSQPETVVFSYSASLAVALSCREAASVGRIWADGKLIRGAAGDLKVGGKFRFLPGTEGQDVDPLIATIEGVGTTPAYRGLALAVFEDLMLGDFGNRIPSLTFELVADASGIGLGAILDDASEGVVECADPRPVAGYALYGQDMESAVAPLVEAFALDLTDEGDAFRAATATAARILLHDEMGVATELGGSAMVERTLLPAASIPTALTMTYYDPSRDFQAGQARASFPSVSRARRAIALPCVLDASAAKGLADTLLEPLISIWIGTGRYAPDGSLSPAQFRGEVRGDGTLELKWVRRSRRGFAWIDAVDVPPDPDLRGYRISIVGPAATADFSVTEPELVMSAIELAGLGAGPLPSPRGKSGRSACRGQRRSSSTHRIFP